MSNVHRFPGGDMPPDFETQMPDDIEVKHCYRHPDRETGVSCSNCGRPICHECMIPAPVGFRCPECVKEQSGRGSRAKVVTRGQIRSRWSSGGIGAPAGLSATKVLIALNVLMFVIELVTGYSSLLGGGTAPSTWGARADPGPRADTTTGACSPACSCTAASSTWDSTCGRCGPSAGSWRPRSAGSSSSSSTSCRGSPARCSSSWLRRTSRRPWGRPGAIFGIFGALAVHAFLNRGRDFQSRALLGNVLFLIVINLVFSFRGGISWQAHIGGLIGGAATMLAMMLAGRKDPRRPFGLADGLAVLGIVFVLLAVTWWQVVTFAPMGL